MTVHCRSVRARFTLWYVVALAAIVILFAVGTHLFVRASLMRQLDRLLAKDLATIEEVLRKNPSEIGEVEEYGSIPFFRVLDNGTPLAASSPWRGAGLENAGQGAAGAPRSWSASGGARYRVRGAHLDTPGNSYLIAVARDEGALHELLRTLSLVFLLGIPGAIVLAVAGGYFLAGRVLAPVSAITAAAREITAERLSARLPVENPDDEFGRLAAVFNETFARLEASFEMLRRFTADASHELRTPLTAIRSVGETALQGEPDRRGYREVIGSMLEEADRLAQLVESLLSLSRADAGSVELKKEEVSLAALAREVVECLNVLAEEKQESLALVVNENATVVADRATLRQAVLNILDNAIKFTPSGGAVQVVVGRRGAGDALLEIRDSGPGIPAEHRPRVFDRFYRVDTGRSREAGGTGLGLAIARWTVAVNSGRIELESEEGRGSIFRIVLPATAPQQPEEPGR